MDLRTFLVIAHVVGTVLGVGGTTFADVYFLKSLISKKGVTEDTEALKVAVLMIRVGLVLLLVSGFAIITLWRVGGNQERFFSERFLAKMSIVLIILINGILLETRKVPIYIAGPISSVSWYSALVLGLWRGLPLSYLWIMLAYAAVIVGGVVTFLSLKKIFKFNL